MVTPRLRVAGRYHEREVVVAEVDGFDFGVLGEAGDRDVRLAGEHALDDVLGLAGAQVDVDARADLAELLQDAGKEVGRDGRRGADAEASDIAVADGFDGVGAFLDGGEGALGVGHEGDTGIGQGDAAAGPFEETLADFAFERLDAGGHGWLGEKQRLGGAAKGAVVGHLDESFELREFHGVSLPRSAGTIPSVGAE
jgi:hypothetical protein